MRTRSNNFCSSKLASKRSFRKNEYQRQSNCQGRNWPLNNERNLTKKHSFGSTHVQYFLANLCDFDVSLKFSTNCLRFPRSPFVPEMDSLAKVFIFGQSIDPDNFDVKVVVTLLKEFLFQLDGGVFSHLTKEFFKISLQSSTNITQIYLHSIIHELPYVDQQSVYLLCKGLANLARLTLLKQPIDNVSVYTDILMNFTPALFPGSWCEIERFLRCSRLLLIMIQNRSEVFLPLPFLDDDGTVCWLNDEIEFEDKVFLRGFFKNVRHLEDKLAESSDSGLGGIDESDTDSELMLLENDPIFELMKNRDQQSLSMPDLYRLTYSIDLDDQQEPDYETVALTASSNCLL